MNNPLTTNMLQVTDLMASYIRRELSRMYQDSNTLGRSYVLQVMREIRQDLDTMIASLEARDA